MAPKSSPRAGARLVPSRRVLSDFARQRLEEKQAAARQLLAQQEPEYRNGNRSALALGIKICGLLREPLPPWIVEAWAKACTDIATREVASWDEVLGNEAPTTGKRQRREQIERTRLGKLLEILWLREQAPIKRGDPPDSFFWFAARHVGIDTAAVRKLYYKHKLNQRSRPA